MSAASEVLEVVDTQGTASRLLQNADGEQAEPEEPGALIAVAGGPVAGPESVDMALPFPAAGKIGPGLRPGFVAPEQGRSCAVLLVQELKQSRGQQDVMAAVTQ